MLPISLDQSALTPDQQDILQQMWRRCLRRIILSTTLAASGHPGGSMSSLHLLLMLYSTLAHRPDDPSWADRDRLVVSMGHISPGVYSVLCEFGYILEENMLLEFRQAESSFAGHIEHCVPGVEWNTGNLGQGLSAATGMALALKLNKSANRVVTLMGDGEQQKGQIAEARRFAMKYGLSNLVGIVDRNHLQIGGATDRVMPQNVRADYAAAGWNVIYLEDGHDFNAIFQALKSIQQANLDDPESPTVIVARTIMGKGISFMENQAKYHGSPLSAEQAGQALEELGLDNPLDAYRKKRGSLHAFQAGYCRPTAYPVIETGTPITYDTQTVTDNRSAYGAALEDLGRLNNLEGTPKVLGFSCDLEGSVKMKGFHNLCPEAFFECGIQEHHTATMAGAVSKENLVAFFSTFGVFGVSEVYNQQRLNDINQTQLKVVCTHLGLDVGEDGQTHQCIDYIGLLENLFGFNIYLAADPNQTDRIVRYIASHPGNVFLGMGRSKLSMVTDADGKLFFAGDYEFRPGQADWVRKGTQGAILTYGPILSYGLQAQERLAREENLDLAVVNFSSIKPLDTDSILQAAETGLIVTAEDHHVNTGLGSRVATVLMDAGKSCRLVRLGVSHYSGSGKPADLYHLAGIDADGITKAVLAAFSKDQ